VVDGDTLALEGGKEVPFVGIQAPKLPLGRANFSTWPLAPEAKTAVETLTLGGEVGLVFAEGGRREDRHGRYLAHLVTREGVWVQGRLLELGLARVYSFPDNRALVAEMLALEREARAAGRGIWSHPFYSLRAARAEALWPLLDSFQLVEGEVREVFSARRNTYLNFGEDWREDFSLQIPADASKLFEEEGVDLAALAGRRVRVRGWIEAYNGPLIRVTHPEQLEILEP
jgi:endonuclease YncB( thermonuclease family)